MNIEKLVRNAVDIIKSKWTLPSSGFIAGGSIANLVWQSVSGNKAVVNDVDIFIFDGVIERIDDSDKSVLFKYQEKEERFWEDYSGMRYGNINRDFYTIVSSENNGMLNIVKYKSNKKDTDLILRSFDINSTKVGYSIEEDKVYWTQEFEEFLNTGQLKVCNLMTPAHTAIRIVKKADELNCKLDDFELKLVKHTIGVRFNDTFKFRFKERYYDLYQRYSEKLNQFFTIHRDKDIEEYIKINFNEVSNIYHLNPVQTDKKIDDNADFVYGHEEFVDDNLRKIRSSFEFLFYMRNIWQKDLLAKLWDKLYFFFKDNSYVDCDPTDEDLELLSRVGRYAPNSIRNLKGKKLSEQLKIVKNVLEIFEEDPIIGISILEKHDLEDVELSPENLLLLELSVRRNIINDTKGKVRKILGIKDDKEITQINLNWLE